MYFHYLFIDSCAMKHMDILKFVNLVKSTNFQMTIAISFLQHASIPHLYHHDQACPPWPNRLAAAFH